MKRILILLLCTFVSAWALMATDTAEVNPIQWGATDHDFGTIHSSGGKVVAKYTLKNNSPEPIAVLSVTNGGCGCTVPAFPKKPIAKGETGTITITFDPARFKGEFRRQVSVTIMSGGRRLKAKLKFSGTIIPD